VGDRYEGTHCVGCALVGRRRWSHNSRAERRTEKSAVTPSAMSVQIKKKAPLDRAIEPPTLPPSCGRPGRATREVTRRGR